MSWGNRANPSKGRQTTTNCSSGAIPLRSLASLVTTACPALRPPHKVSAGGLAVVARRGSCQQQAYCCRVRPVRRNKVRTGLSNEPAEASLPGRVPNGLCQRRRRNCNTHATLGRARDECEHAAVVSVQGDQPTSVESDAGHAAFPFPATLFCPWGERSASAHARSFFISGPPVCCSASSSISLHPAASKRATPTACFTKAETFEI